MYFNKIEAFQPNFGKLFNFRNFKNKFSLFLDFYGEILKILFKNIFNVFIKNI